MVSSALPLRRTSHRLLSCLRILSNLLLGFVEYFIPESWRYESISGSRVLITGGGSGIGQLMALRFLAQGCTVILWDVNDRGLRQTVELAKSRGLDTSKLTWHQIDLRSRQAIYETARTIGEIDILVNNAGIVTGRLFLDQPDASIQATFDVNVLAHFWTVKAFLPGMITRKSGHIVTVASVAGNIVSCSMSDYHASKFANVGFDMALRVELAQASLDSFIHTTIVKPFFIDTGMFSGVASPFIPCLKPEYVAKRIVDGVRARTKEIVLPHFFTFVFQLIAVMPSKASIALLDLLGGFEAMSHFKGRAQATPPADGAEVNNNLLDEGKERGKREKAA